MPRLTFINWRPDLEDEANDGLVVADNVLHEPEGYKAVYLSSAGQFSTTGGLAASVATVMAVAAKPVGNDNDLLVAWIANDQLHLGLNGTTLTSNTTGYPLTFTAGGTSAAISLFDVCESNNKIFFLVKGVMTTAGAPSAKQYAGYLDY